MAEIKTIEQYWERRVEDAGKALAYAEAQLDKVREKVAHTAGQYVLPFLLHQGEEGQGEG